MTIGVISSMYFTITLASNNQKDNMPQMMDKNYDNNSDVSNSKEGNQPPDKPDDNNATVSDDSVQNNQMSPSDKSSDNNMTPPDNNEQNSNNSNSNQHNNKMQKSGRNNNSMNNRPNDMRIGKVKNNDIVIIYYILLAIESMVLGAVIIYLIMSNFNKKKLKESFDNNDKIIIYILSTLVTMIVFTTTSYYLINLIPNKNTISNTINSAKYSAANKITKATTINNKKYESSTKDENVILTTGNINVAIKNSTIDKSGDSNGGDNTSFYGTNSAILAKDGSTLNIKNTTITTNANGANGVFSYGGSATTNNSSGDGTTINISDSKITTTKDSSGGIMTTGGGIINAKNLTISTAGTSSAAIRSDRGGGTVKVNGGTYKTTGKGSPTIYSTANITVKNAKLVATSSEGAIIEGKNSIKLDNVDLIDTNDTLNGQSTTYKNIFIYQSMSGDAATGKATFTAKNSNITTNKGDTLYVTNTKATINLTNNKIINNDNEGNFLRIQKDSWGNNGSNGGDVVLNLTNQEVDGDIVVDEISTLTMNMKNSNYEGGINSSNSAKNIKLVLDKDSKITLTGNSYITTLSNSVKDNSNINFNGYKLYVNGEAIN